MVKLKETNKMIILKKKEYYIKKTFLFGETVVWSTDHNNHVCTDNNNNVIGKKNK